MARRKIHIYSLFIISCVLILFSLSACKNTEKKVEKNREEAPKILYRGLPVEPLSLDPHKGLGSWVQDIVGDMIVGLYVEDASGKVIPALAETVTISDDGKHWKFTLKDSKWSDGKPVTAQDFVFAFQRLINPKTVSPYASLHFGLKNAEKINQGEFAIDQLGVRALNKKTLEFELEYPMPYFKKLLSHYASLPLPKHIISKYGDNWVKPDLMVVNGPYRLEKWRLNDYISLVRNRRYYKKDLVCFDKVVYQKTQDPEAAIRLVKKGALDIGWEGPGETLDVIERDFPDYLHNYPMLETDYIVFNTRRSPFQKAQVRKALSMAINRDYIVEYVLKAAQPVYAFVPPKMGNYLPVEKRPQVKWKGLSLKKRQKKALELLQKAGFGSDHPLQFEYLYRNNKDSSRIATLIQNDWNSLAPWVRVSIIGVDTQLQIKRLRLGNFEVAEAGWVADYDDPYSFLFLAETSAGPLNYGHYSNKDYDRLLEKANLERDPEKRAEFLAKAEEILLEETAIAPLWNSFALHMVNPKITGFVDNAADNHRSEYLCQKGS